jgi:hypothetical protein
MRIEKRPFSPLAAPANTLGGPFGRQFGGQLSSAKLQKETGRCMWNAPARRAGRQFLNEP